MALWWKNVLASKRRNGKCDVITWAEMKGILQRWFVPEYYNQDLLMQLHSLRQGNMNVVEYTQEFEILTMCSQITETLEQTIIKYYWVTV